MAMSVGNEGGSGGGEIVDINTTPLIDVMLVLLIMFIITIPIQTHAVKLDLPVGPPPNQTNVQPVVNNLEIDFTNQIYWNRQPVTLDQVKAYFRQASKMTPEPELRVRPDPQAKFAVVDELLAAAQTAGVTKMGFIGNEQYATQ